MGSIDRYEQLFKALIRRLLSSLLLCLSPSPCLFVAPTLCLSFSSCLPSHCSPSACLSLCHGHSFALPHRLSSKSLNMFYSVHQTYDPISRFDATQLIRVNRHLLYPCYTHCQFPLECSRHISTRGDLSARTPPQMAF